MINVQADCWWYSIDCSVTQSCFLMCLLRRCNAQLKITSVNHLKLESCYLQFEWHHPIAITSKYHSKTTKPTPISCNKSFEPSRALLVRTHVSATKKTQCPQSLVPSTKRLQNSFSDCPPKELSCSVWVSDECIPIKLTIDFDCCISPEPLHRFNSKLHHSKDADPQILKKTKFDRFRSFLTEICDDRRGAWVLEVRNGSDDQCCVRCGECRVSENEFAWETQCQLAPAQATCLEWLGIFRREEARQRLRCFRNGTSWSQLEHKDAS